jgi:hypothetical protein
MIRDILTFRKLNAEFLLLPFAFLPLLPPPEEKCKVKIRASRKNSLSSFRPAFRGHAPRVIKPESIGNDLEKLTFHRERHSSESLSFLLILSILLILFLSGLCHCRLS